MRSSSYEFRIEVCRPPSARAASHLPRATTSMAPAAAAAVLKPEDVQLPSSNLTSSYIFAYNSDFLVYNNDANRHIRYYRNTFQHGGISMEEMIVPYIVLKPKQ